MNESAFETRMLKCIFVQGNEKSNNMRWVDADGTIYNIRVGELQLTDVSTLLHKWYFVQCRFFQGKRQVQKLVPVRNDVYMNRTK